MGGVDFSAPRILRADDSVEGFSSGNPLIDNWVKARAHHARRLGTAVVYASFCGSRLAGFYTLSASSILRSDATGWIARNAPEQIPVILLGMLGVDVRWQGQGLGRNLLLDATHRAISTAQHIGAKALVVDPVDQEIESFYLRYGFHQIPGLDRLYAKLTLE